ncbi:histone acetyltransferases subunit 3-domain-containing protein [Cladochytrium replicatum]|nr:histone acetyltransferases subunit 3-domain-containing protein [Cladochytrium replicatum]
MDRQMHLGDLVLPPLATQNRLFHKYLLPIAPGSQQTTPNVSQTVPSTTEIHRLRDDLEGMLAVTQERKEKIQESIATWSSRIQKNGGTVTSVLHLTEKDKEKDKIGSAKTGIRIKVKDEGIGKDRMDQDELDDAPPTARTSEGSGKRKRSHDTDDLSDSEKDKPMLIKKSDDGGIKITISHGGTLKIKKTATNPDPAKQSATSPVSTVRATKTVPAPPPPRIPSPERDASSTTHAPAGAKSLPAVFQKVNSAFPPSLVVTEAPVTPVASAKPKPLSRTQSSKPKPSKNDILSKPNEDSLAMPTPLIPDKSSTDATTQPSMPPPPLRSDTTATPSAPVVVTPAPSSPPTTPAPPSDPKPMASDEIFPPATPFTVPAQDKPSLADIIGVGTPMDGDFSKVKVPTQIAVTAFWSFAEQYFRSVTVEDARFLEDHGDPVTPFIVPKLGKHYAMQWKEEDSAAAASAAAAAASAAAGVSGEFADEQGGGDYGDEDGGIVRETEPYFGPLTERIVAAFVKEGVVGHFFDSGGDGDAGGGGPLAAAVAKAKVRNKTEMAELEERVRIELAHVGLIENKENENDEAAQKEDEIWAELKAKQEELRERISVNTARKIRLLAIAKTWMAVQEFNSVLEEQNKAIEAAYTRRFKQKNKRKKLSVAPGTDSVSQKGLPSSYGMMSSAPDNFMVHIQKRTRLIDAFNTMFDMNKLAVPQTSIYADLFPEGEDGQVGGEIGGAEGVGGSVVVGSGGVRLKVGSMFLRV